MALRTSTIDIDTSDGVCDAFLAAPEDNSHYPGVVLYMDAFGPRPQLEEMAERIAHDGYVVLVPNLFYREGPAPVVDTSDLMDPEARAAKFKVLMPMIRALTPELSAADSDAYLDYLAAHDQVTDEPVGVVGYCMGGAHALRAAAHRPDDVAAAALFHPARLATDEPDSPHLLVDRLQAEVYVAAAEGDQGFPPEQQQRLDDALTEAGVTHTVVQYGGAQHGFTMADTAVHDEAAADRHWTALLDLFRRTLR